LAPQLIPDGEEVTVPPPAPDLETVREWFCVPLNGTFSVGRIGSVEITVRLAFLGPGVTGEKEAFTVQLPEATSVCPEQRSFDFGNSGSTVPTEVTSSDVVPELVIVNIIGDELVPTATPPKSPAGGETEIPVTPVASVSALRETSVLFGTLLGAWLLKERLGAQRLLGAVVIVTGVVALRFG